MKCTRFLLLFVLVSGYAFAQGTKKSDPCSNAQTQAEMNDCAGKEYKAADAALNQVYRQLVSMLDDEEKSQLKEVQTAWLKYRDLNCDFVADQYKGGTIRPTIHALACGDSTELRNQIKDRNQ